MSEQFGLTRRQSGLKRSFDICGAFFGLCTLWWLILIAWLIASVDTRQNGFFRQLRVGKDGQVFEVVKIRTMRAVEGIETTVTRRGDPRITRWGSFFRRVKIDELPQLWNVLIGEMSFVGPRPDVPGFADQLSGEARQVLRLRPGITGPATLKYRDEEKILARQVDPEAYNREVIFPDKVRINLAYMRDWSLHADLRYILKTLVA